MHERLPHAPVPSPVLPFSCAEPKLWRFAPNDKPSGAIQKKVAFKKQKAIFSIVRATHQKGPLAGNVTNNVITFLRGADGNNDKLRATVAPLLLGERLKWNAEQVAFGVRVYTKKQAAKLLAAFRASLGADATDVPDAVDDAPWTDDTNAAVSIVPCKEIVDADASAQFADAQETSNERDVILLDGVTYPLKEALKEMGFVWTTDFNNIPGANHWVAQADDARADIRKVAALFDEWGWVVTIYDGVDENDN